jgi:hypothetical protein
VPREAPTGRPGRYSPAVWAFVSSGLALAGTGALAAGARAVAVVLLFAAAAAAFTAVAVGLDAHRAWEARMRALGVDPRGRR